MQNLLSECSGYEFDIRRLQCMEMRLNMKSRLRLYDITYSFVGAFLFIVGKIIYDTNRLESFMERSGYYIVIGAAVWVVILTALLLTEYLTGKFRVFKEEKDKQVLPGKIFMALMLITVVMYSLCYLAYFPGIFSYDIKGQVDQVAGISPYCNYQPVLHTLLWKGATYLERLVGVHPAGLVAYCILQMLITIAVCGYMLLWMERRGVYRMIVLLSWGYITFMPTLQIFSVITTKDIYFSDALIILVTSLYDIGTEEKFSRFRLGGAILAGIVACLLRNNMIYAVVFAFLVCLVMKGGKRMLLTVGSIAAGAVFLTKIIYPAMGVESVMPREALSVPMQQMSNVFINAPETFKEEEMQIFMEYVPWAGNYNPRFADVVKSGFEDENYKERTKTFWKLWFEIGTRVPMHYIDAFLTLNIPLWYPMAEPIDPYADREYIETKMLEKDEYKVEWMGVFPGLYEYYEGIAEFRNPGMNLFLLKPLFSLGFPMVTMYFGIYFICRDKRKEYFWIYMIYAGVFLTYLFGPVSNFRYIYPFCMAAPLLWIPVTCRRNRLYERNL